MTEKQNTSQKKRRINPLLIMVVLFGFPYVISWYMFYSGDSLFFKEGESEGVLISPVREIPQFNAVDIYGNNVDRQALIGKWTFLMVGPSTCNALCKETLVTIRQVRLAQAVDRKRVQRFWLLTENRELEALKGLKENGHYGLTVLKYEQGTSKAFSSVLTQGGGGTDDFSLYLVDPLGNLMMFYAPGTEDKKILKDVKRLLKFSDLGE